MRNATGLTLTFIKNISVNLTQFVSWLLLVSAMTMLLAFSEMISTYESFFIEKLKSVYPNIFLYTAKKEIKPLDEYISHEKEIFEIIWQEFDYSYDAKTSQTKANISLRSFSKEHIPKILSPYTNDIKNEKDIIFINSEFYDKLVANPDFEKGLYLKSYIDKEFHIFEIKPFEMYDETEWILIPNHIAKKLFYKAMFEHTVVYSHKYDENELYQKYIKVYPKLLLWSDKVPLFSRSSLAILQSAFGVIILTTLILTIATIFIVLKSIIDEYVLFTKQVLRFGMNVPHLYQIFLVLFFSYISSIILLSYSIIYFTKKWLAPALMDAISTDMITSLTFLIVLAFSISLSIVFGLFQYVFAAMKKRELV